MILGLVVGLGLFFAVDHDSRFFENAIWWLDLFGKEVFIRALKMIIAPLIFASIVAGICSLPSARELGNIGLKTFIYYFSTTGIAVGIGVAAVLIIQPGAKDASQKVRAERQEVIDGHREVFTVQHGRDPEESPQAMAEFRRYIGEQEGEGLSASDFGANWSRITSAEARGPGDMFKEEILRPILTNPANAIAQPTPNALGLITFAIMVGLACVVIGEPARPVAHFFQGCNDVMMKITLWLMEIAPVAIGCIIASLVATLGINALRSLAWYCVTVVGGLAIHVCVLLALVAFIGKMSPAKFLRGIRNAWLIAFSTTSSAATLPVTLHCTTENLGVDPKVARFSLPLGATMNMDGTALYEGVAVIFLIQMFGGLEDVPIVLGGMQTFIIFITAVLASVGAAAVPSAGLITMAIVASAVGLPLHYIFFIFAVDRLLDMFRTSTNVLGDAAGAVIVNRLEAGRL